MYRFTNFISNSRSISSLKTVTGGATERREVMYITRRNIIIIVQFNSLLVLAISAGLLQANTKIQNKCNENQRIT
jgi:hypothetical protein